MTATALAGLKLEPRYQYMPEMIPHDFKQLKRLIAEHGFYGDQAVVLDEEGRILDGHHRAKACAELGVECPTRVLAGLTEQEKDDYIWAVNIGRRHIPLKERLELARHRLKVRPEASNRAVARDVGVSPTTVGALREELQETDHLDSFEAKGGRGQTTGSPVEFSRCEVCERPVKVRNEFEADDGRRGHRACLDPGVGQDLPDHRAAVVFWVSADYSAPNEHEVHERPGGPGPREQERLEWGPVEVRMTRGSPRSEGDARQLFVELAQRLLEISLAERPFATMLESVVNGAAG